MDKDAMIWLKGYTYRASKALLGWKQQVDKNTLLETCLGKSFEEWQAQETKNTLATMMN